MASQLDEGERNVPVLMLSAWPTIAAYLSVYIGTMILAYKTKPEKYGVTTKEERKKIKQLEKLVKQQTPPTLPKEETTIDYSISDVIRYFYASTKTLDKQARAKKSPLLAMRAAMKYFGTNHHDLDEALLIIRDAHNWLEHKKPKLTLQAKTFNLNNAWAVNAIQKLTPKSYELQFFLAMYYSIVNPEKAWQHGQLGRKITDEFYPEQKDVAYVFHALLASAQDRSDKEQAWNDAITVLNEKPEWERIGETRTTVRVLKDRPYFSKTFLFKERPEKELLQREAENSKTLAELVDAEFPEPLHLTEEPTNGNYTYVMRILEGPTLYEQLEQKNTTSIRRVIKTLADIHAKYPRQLKRTNLEEKLKEKLNSYEFGLTNTTANSIYTNFKPALQDVNDMIWVWNKDAHPENWITGEKIGVIDLEADHLAPATFDLANLLEYGDYFSPNEKRTYVHEYAEHMNQHGQHIKHSTLMRKYYNSVIYRMICLTSAWSSPQRPKMKHKRKEAIQRAINSIEKVKQEDKEYYGLHHEEYALLRNNLEQLKNTL